MEMFVKSLPITINKTSMDVQNPFSKLSVRELEVLHYLLNGYRTKEISVTLGLKINTISTIKMIIFENGTS